MAADMSEAEARRIYDLKYSLCKVFGGDVRRDCLEAGVPETLVDEFLENDKLLDRFIDSHDQSGNPIRYTGLHPPPGD